MGYKLLLIEISAAGCLFDTTCTLNIAGNKKKTNFRVERGIYNFNI